MMRTALPPAMMLVLMLGACAASGPYIYHAEPVAWVDESALLVRVSQDRPAWAFAITKTRGPHRYRTPRSSQRWLHLSLPGGACAWDSAGEPETLQQPSVVDRLHRSYVLPDHDELMARMRALCPTFAPGLQDDLRHDPDTPLIAHFRGGFLVTLFDRRDGRCVDASADPTLRRARRFYAGTSAETLLVEVAHEDRVALWDLAVDGLAMTHRVSYALPHRERWPDHERGDMRIRLWHVGDADLWVLLRGDEVAYVVAGPTGTHTYPIVGSAAPRRDAWPLRCAPSTEE
mgnify:CR=1 FL=1